LKANLESQLENVGDIPESPMTKALQNELDSMKALRSQKRREMILTAEKAEKDLVSSIPIIDKYSNSIQEILLKQNQKVLELKLKALEDVTNIFNSFDRFKNQFHIRTEFKFMGGELAFKVYNGLLSSMSMLKEEVKDG